MMNDIPQKEKEGEEKTAPVQVPEGTTPAPVVPEDAKPAEEKVEKE